jgi:hypothetical protein
VHQADRPAKFATEPLRATLDSRPSMKDLAERRNSVRPKAELDCDLKAPSSCFQGSSEPDHLVIGIPWHSRIVRKRRIEVPQKAQL